MEPLGLRDWLAAVFTVVGFILEILSFSIPYWNRFEALENWGLWQRCIIDLGCIQMPSNLLSDTMSAGRGILVVGLVAYVILVILVALYVFWRRHNHLVIGGMIAAFVAVTSSLVGAIFWASTTNTSVSWCYYLSYVSGMCAATSGGVLTYIKRQSILKDLQTNQGVI